MAVIFRSVNNTQSSSDNNHNLSAGNKVLLRTAVHGWAGCVSRIFRIEGVAFVELTDASWIADTGRYGEAHIKGIEAMADSEIEKVPCPVLVQLESIGDVTLLPSLPTETK